MSADKPCPTGPLPRKCPWVSCKYHMAISVTDAGALQHLDLKLIAASELAEAAAFEDRVVQWLATEHWHCAHDIVAKLGAQTLQAVADHFGVTRERIRQIEGGALIKLRARLPDRAFRSLGEFLEVSDEHVLQIGKRARARQAGPRPRAEKHARLAGVRKTA